MMCSYQTAQGVVHGIQWVPAEATQILPTGAQPANAVRPQIARVLPMTSTEFMNQEFAASFNRGQLSREEERELDKWYGPVNVMLLHTLHLFQETL